jgi:hypothetical protein
MDPFEATPTRAKDLVPLIEAPLLKKLPALSGWFTQIAKNVCTFKAHSVPFSSPTSPCYHPPTSELLQPATTGDLAIVITAALQEFTGREAAAGCSEDMMHLPLDMMLRLPLNLISERTGGILPILIDRNRVNEYVLAHIFDRCFLSSLLV